MIRQWEEFQVGPGNVGDELRVTLSRKGEIMVGAAAFEKLGRPEVAVLLFDKVNSVIGVSPSNKHAKNGYPLKVKTGAKHRVLRANRFCRHYGIKVDRTVAFNRPEIDEEGILVLDLKATSGVGK
jgi:hypothetical protein